MLQQKGCPLPTYHVTSMGQSHCPIHVGNVTVHYGGRELKEEVGPTGGKRRDVEKIAAEKMLRRIRQEGNAVMATPRSENSQSTRTHSISPAPSARRVCPAVATRSASLSPHGLARSPSPPGRSPVTVLQERLQCMSLSLPKYKELEVSSAHPVFRVQCLVYNSRQQPVIKSQGEGRSKKTAKDAAARDMLQKMGSVSLERLPPLSATVVPDIPEVVDPDLDDDIAISLSPYSPKYHFWQCPGEVHLPCSGCTSLHAVHMYCRCVD